MPRIDHSVIVHKLNVSSSFVFIRQKKRVFMSERYKAIVEEVHKLHKAIVETGVHVCGFHRLK